MEEWVEAQLLPMIQRDAFFESALLDHVISNYDVSNISSLQDCMKFVTTQVNNVVTVTTAGTAKGSLERVARKLYLYIVGKTCTDVTGLDKMLKSLQKTQVSRVTIIEQYYDEGKPFLVLSLPNYDHEDEDTLKVLVLLIGFACTLHQTPIENVKICKENDLGTGKLTISSSYRSLINGLTVSAKSSLGLYAGETLKYSSDFIGNAVECLAAMRLLNIKEEFIRKRKFKKDSNKSSVSFNTLSETFNNTCGLKATGEISFIQKFISCIELLYQEA